MKKLITFLTMFLMLSGVARAEIVRLNCSFYLANTKDPITSYFELNSETGNYYNIFTDHKIFWTSVTEESNDRWIPIYHSVDRITGVYTVAVGVTGKYPKKRDPMVEIVQKVIGTCVKADGKKKF